MDMIIGRSSRYAGLVLRNTSCHLPKVSLGPAARCLCQCYNRWQDFRVYDTNHGWSIAVGNNHFRNNLVVSRIHLPDYFLHHGINDYSTNISKQPDKDSKVPLPPEKLPLFQRMKQMTKDYWHILIPVHVVTSIGWISIFYAAAKNGVNIVSILESMNLSERYLDIMRGSNAGHWAVAYALYKLFTPVRYTVTLGGTTMSIRYLNRWGYLKFKPRSTIKEKRSSECAPEQTEKFVKTGFKNQQQTEPPKT